MVFVAVLSAAGIRHLQRAKARRKREATYQAALRAYSHDLQRGLTRKEVEAYLRARNTDFRQECCTAAGYYADLIRVGEEDPPWYCSESYVYVAIEFTAMEPHSRPYGYSSALAMDSDVLTRIEIDRPDTGCL
jgi:hypothetical protein